MGYTLLHNNVAYPGSRAEPSTGGRDGRGNCEGEEMLCDKGGCHVGITGSKGVCGRGQGVEMGDFCVETPAEARRLCGLRLLDERGSGDDPVGRV
jgi:hypothetical protein